MRNEGGGGEGERKRMRNNGENNERPRAFIKLSNISMYYIHRY